MVRNELIQISIGSLIIRKNILLVFFTLLFNKIRWINIFFDLLSNAYDSLMVRNGSIFLIAEDT